MAVGHCRLMPGCTLPRPGGAGDTMLMSVLEMATRAWGCPSFPVNRSGQLAPAGPPLLSTATGPTTITGPPSQRPPVCAVGVGPHLTSDHGRHSGQPLAAKPSPPAP